MHTIALTQNDKLICFREDSDGQFTVTENGVECVYSIERIAFFLFWLRAILGTEQTVTTSCFCCGLNGQLIRYPYQTRITDQYHVF
ncbi:hypothetical protein [Shimazuella kribbensis]|uniref:hypothetical protein n=1 Tax=Shimazuella kribbensis TaxID=139808 RepID=UPI0003FFE2F4|nr:hypothetical protein [Shimazuella kribbensis]